MNRIQDEPGSRKEDVTIRSEEADCVSKIRNRHRRLFSGSCEDSFDRIGIEGRIESLYGEVTEVVESLPYSGEIKLAEEVKLEIVKTANRLRSLVSQLLTEPGTIKEIDDLVLRLRGDFSDNEDPWDFLDKEQEATHIIRQKLTKENVGLVMDDSLRRVHANNLVTVMRLAIEDREINVSNERGQQFSEEMKALEEQVWTTESCTRFCDRAHYWYEALIPSDRGLALVDRRINEHSSKVKGFELSSYMPSRYEISERIPGFLPPALAVDDVDDIHYHDYYSDYGEAMTHLMDNGRLIVRFFKNTPPGSFFNHFRHELGHCFALRKSDLLQYLDWVKDMLEGDKQQVGKDIFSTGMSRYPIATIHEAEIPSEALAELWLCAGDPNLRERIEKELPCEAKILHDLENQDALNWLIPG